MTEVKDDLPELPPSLKIFLSFNGEDVPVNPEAVFYSADQLQSYARLAVQQERHRIANWVCSMQMPNAQNFAIAIRQGSYK